MRDDLVSLKRPRDLVTLLTQASSYTNDSSRIHRFGNDMQIPWRRGRKCEETGPSLQKQQFFLIQ